MLIYEIILGNHIRTLYRHYTDHLSKWCGFIQKSICNKMNLSQERCCERGPERGKTIAMKKEKTETLGWTEGEEKTLESLPLESRDIRKNIEKVKIQWIIPIWEFAFIRW